MRWLGLLSIALVLLRSAAFAPVAYADEVAQLSSATGPNPSYALVLGSVAGFGLGHFYANEGRWTSDSTRYAIWDTSAAFVLVALLFGISRSDAWGTVSAVGLTLWPFALAGERVSQGLAAQVAAQAKQRREGPAEGRVEWGFGVPLARIRF